MRPETPPHIPLLRGPTQLVRQFAEQFLRPGDRAVDATCGNGHDTLLLAELTGPQGKVWAFDIQDEAITETASKLAHAGLADRVELLHTGHETMAEHIPGPLAAVIFNLGYRPGGNHAVITRPDTTLSALEQAAELLAPRGFLAVTMYPGHPGGADEEHAVNRWMQGLEQRQFHVWRMGQANVSASAPYLFLAQKVS